MKTAIITAAATLAATFCSCTQQPQILGEGLKFTESTYPYGNGILVANFGSDALNPLNSEGKGYIMYFEDGKETGEVFIKPDGNLSAPKGMLVHGNRLMICDVNKIVAYDLNNLEAAPLTIPMGEGNMFVNDLVSDGNYIYASVTDSDIIFRIHANEDGTFGTPERWLEVPGPNGLALHQGSMYIASYPPDGNTATHNVIYRVQDLDAPAAEVFINTPGQYDGIAFSADGSRMFITNWAPAGISSVDMATLEVKPLDMKLEVPVSGPADITSKDGKIYIPDLPGSRVIVIDAE